MYYQNKPGIYVYQHNIFYYEEQTKSGMSITYYETLNDFFKQFWKESQLKYNVSTNVNDRFCQAVIGQTKRRFWKSDVICNKLNCTEHNDYNDHKIKANVVYDHNGKIFTPEHLLGLFRKYRKPFNRRYASSGRKSKHRRYVRRIKTFQERKWAHAWDDEEFAPKVRLARQGKVLPNPWDDIKRYNQKSWKKHRKHQWKEKKHK